MLRGGSGGSSSSEPVPAEPELVEQHPARAELVRLAEENERLASDLGSTRLELARANKRSTRAGADATAKARQILEEAEAQAAKLQHDAELSMVEAAQRLDDVLQLREQLLGEVRGLLQAYTALLEQAEQGEIEPVGARVDAGEVVEPQQGRRGRQNVAAIEANGRPEGVFATRVELDAGPFDDQAKLFAFERILTKLPGIEDVRIRGFSHGRGAIELVLLEERPLVDDLDSTLPYRFSVIARQRDRLSIQIETGS